MNQVTRRQFLLGASGVTASVAGCATGQRSPPEPATPATGEQDRSGQYTTVYDSTIESVTYVGDERSGGSGFVYEDFVITNEHVVSGADRVDVRFAAGQWREGAVQATDVYADLAVIATDIPDAAGALSLVDAVPPVGTEILALGSPFGLESSLSQGIISGKNRSLTNPDGYSIPNTVQTDAGLDPGNSGGPLVTLDGEVTGIVVAGAGTSVGFAVSPLLAQRVLPELIATGTYRHPYLGVHLLPVTPTIAEANGLATAEGVLIIEVLDGGPTTQPLQGADDETIVDGRRIPTGGDVLVELAGNAIESNADLGTTLALELSPGDQVPATVIRDGEREQLQVPVGARPEPDR